MMTQHIKDYKIVGLGSSVWDLNFIVIHFIVAWNPLGKSRKKCYVTYEIFMKQAVRKI